MLAGKAKKMSMISWFAAMQRYAITADGVGMWKYASILAHIDICMQIASRAGLDEKERRHHLGQLYDEVARKEWSARASRGECCNGRHELAPHA